MVDRTAIDIAEDSWDHFFTNDEMDKRLRSHPLETNMVDEVKETIYGLYESVNSRWIVRYEGIGRLSIIICASNVYLASFAIFSNTLQKRQIVRFCIIESNLMSSNFPFFSLVLIEWLDPANVGYRAGKY